MKKSLVGFIETFVVGIFLSILIMVFVGQSLEITGESMYPTLKDKERIVVEKVTYKSRAPERGEIVIFRSLQDEATFLIKRVIAVPGDIIGLDGEKILINGTPIDESYLPESVTINNLGELVNYSNSPIPNNYFAVMGDNRSESFDSRMFGLIPFDNFVGKAFVVYWPPTNVRKL